MTHRAGVPRLVTAVIAAVVGILSLTPASAARAQSQDTTGRGGWGIVYSSPRSRQQQATGQKVTATPATPQAAPAPAPTGAANPAGGAASTNSAAGGNNGAGSAAAGWANGAAPTTYNPGLPANSAAPNSPAANNAAANSAAANNAAYNPPPPTPQIRGYSADPAPANGGAVATNRGYAGDPAPNTASPAPAPGAGYGGRVPGVIYSSNGGVYPPPSTNYAPAPAAAYSAAPSAGGYPAPPPGYSAPAAPGANGYASGGVSIAPTTPADRPTNLPPGGRTDASYDAADTVPPPPPPPAGGAAAPVSSIHLDELMSLHEWESSGVSRLRPQEIAVLEHWIERYRQQVADSVTKTLQSSPRGPLAAAAAPLPPISRTADGTPRNAHAVVAIRSGSRYVTLDDGSVWDVYTSDQTETAAWQQGDLVQVRVAPVAYGEFDHELVNNQRTGPVRAKFMGYAPKQQ
ncbi:MAG TPA: hypothetical protein VNW46_14575 [Gemmatimonadaceae bacterium]|nr:hypothetical protein [Gemmatimonadaceae bacterium]